MKNCTYRICGPAEETDMKQAVKYENRRAIPIYFVKYFQNIKNLVIFFSVVVDIKNYFVLKCKVLHPWLPLELCDGNLDTYLIMDFWSTKHEVSLAMRNSPKEKLSSIISLIIGNNWARSQRSQIYGIPGHQFMAGYPWKIWLINWQSHQS